MTLVSLYRSPYVWILSTKKILNKQVIPMPNGFSITYIDYVILYTCTPWSIWIVCNNILPLHPNFHEFPKDCNQRVCLYITLFGEIMLRYHIVCVGFFGFQRDNFWQEYFALISCEELWELYALMQEKKTWVIDENSSPTLSCYKKM